MKRSRRLSLTIEAAGRSAWSAAEAMSTSPEAQESVARRILRGNLVHERIDHALGVRLVLCRKQKARGAHVPPSEPVRAKICRGRSDLAGWKAFMAKYPSFYERKIPKN